MDIAATLTTCLAGLHLIDVRRREYDWAFEFAANVRLRVECPWRILVDGQIAFAGSDAGHKFGLPAPIDGEERTRRLLGQKTVQQILIRNDTGDLTITFTDYTAWSFSTCHQDMRAGNWGQWICTSSRLAAEN